MSKLLEICRRLGKARLVGLTIALLAVVVLLDWIVGDSVSLGVLYILPTMLGAVVMRPLEIGGLSVICAILRAQFDTSAAPAETALRFAFALLAYLISGLFVTSLVRNQQLTLDHLTQIQKEQGLRREAEEQLRVLVESSPAAIMTLNNSGVVIAANRAADSLFSIPKGATIMGREMANYLPVLHDAIRFQLRPLEFRTSAQCQGRKETGELFLGHTWFSSYATEKGVHLAAIVVDSSEEMREQEEQSLEYLGKYNRIAAAAMSHEVLSICGAISVCSAVLREKHHLEQDEQYGRLLSLIKGLQKIATFELHSRGPEEIEPVPLGNLLDTLRIIVEGEWHEIDGKIFWPPIEQLPAVLGEPHGLLQALLNLLHNSFRAVSDSSVRELRISAKVQEMKILLELWDTGPGVAKPEELFQPFRSGAGGTGLGLYISRAILRSYGGDLRFEPRESGSCFVLELNLA